MGGAWERQTRVQRSHGKGMRIASSFLESVFFFIGVGWTGEVLS